VGKKYRSDDQGTIRVSRGRVVEEGGAQSHWRSFRCLRGREGSIGVSHQRGGRLPRLPVGSSRRSAARERRDDPVWRSQLSVVRSGRLWCLKTLDDRDPQRSVRSKGREVEMTFVASRRPPMPTSRMTMSTASSKIRSAVNVRSSKEERKVPYICRHLRRDAERWYMWKGRRGCC